MKIILCDQLSDIWWACHRGIPGSSDMDSIITPVKGELSKSADKLMYRLIADTYCQSPNYFTQRGGPVNSFAIQQGKDMEAEARRWLALDEDLDIHRVGICFNDDFSWCSSPDGLIGLEYDQTPGGEWCGQPWYYASAAAAVELKCPLLETHVGYVAEGILPVDYKPQCHNHLIICNVTRVEFVSYGNFPKQLRVKVEADDYTDKVRKAQAAFTDRYHKVLEEMRGR